MKIKYEIGEEVFFMYNNKINKKPITGVLLTEDSNFQYRTNFNYGGAGIVTHVWLNTEEIFESREELITSL